MTGQFLYSPEPVDALIVRPLDDIVLIYHRPSGQTHMVMSPVPEILAALQADGQGSALAMHDRLAVDYDLGEAGAATAEIAAHLEELAALGLVHRL
jgi:PqqD family protein of HPr-rel-A system